MELSVEELQRNLLNKVIICFGMLASTTSWIVDDETFDNFSRSQQIKYCQTDTILESLKMMEINYLYALLGSGKCNELSFFNNTSGEDLTFVKNQCNSVGELINRLKIARDKIYSHFDKNFFSEVKDITTDEFRTLIEIVEKIMKKLYD